MYVCEISTPNLPPSLTHWGISPVQFIINNLLIFIIMDANAQNLKFLRSMSVEQFKAEKNLTKLGIANTKNGRCLYDGLNVVGAVSTKHADITKPVISEVKGDPTELNPTGVFFLLHQQGEGGLKIDVEL